jgi:hypothetical protein
VSPTRCGVKQLGVAELVARALRRGVHVSGRAFNMSRVLCVVGLTMGRDLFLVSLYVRSNSPVTLENLVT